MGRRGPAPTPTSILNARGSWRGKARDRKKEPKPAVELPTCPDWLDARAVTEWERITPLLAELKVISQIDRAALACYCVSWSDLITASIAIEENGPMFQNDEGYWIQSPAVSQKKAALAAVLRFSQEFGLTPASRARVTTAKADDDAEDDVDDRMLG